MGFFDKLFGKPTDDSTNGQNTKNTLIDTSQISNKESLDNSFDNMDESEIERMIDKLVKEDSFSDSFEYLKTDPLFLEAARLVVQQQQGSTSLIQRTLSIGYNRSGRIIDQLEEFGIVGPFLGDKARTVNFRTLVELENFLQKCPNLRSKEERFYEKHKELIDSRRREYIKNQQIENDRLEKEAIKQKLIEKERKKRLHKEALAELIEAGEIFNHFTNREGKRETIPQDVMDKVWNRDGGMCVKCGSQENLEFDHIIPFSKGGATTYRNMQLLCKKCNLEKTNRIG
jgi:hypothetical protein